MNRNGQTVLGFILVMLLAQLVWWFFAADTITYYVNNAITSGTLSGVESFLLANFNLWFMVIWVITLAVGYRGFSE